MERPAKFSTAVALSTPIMSVAYLSLGVIGYWSKGGTVPEIIIFGTGVDAWARVAAGAILFQAIAPLSLADQPALQAQIPGVQGVFAGGPSPFTGFPISFH
jgi:hypothetical protein